MKTQLIEQITNELKQHPVFRVTIYTYDNINRDSYSEYKLGTSEKITHYTIAQLWKIINQAEPTMTTIHTKEGIFKMRFDKEKILHLTTANEIERIEQEKKEMWKQQDQANQLQTNEGRYINESELEQFAKNETYRSFREEERTNKKILHPLRQTMNRLGVQQINRHV